MSEESQGPGWWQASDLKWYPPELHTDYVPPPLPPPPTLPPPPPTREPGRQQPDDLTPAATQQHPPAWAPAPSPEPADRPPPQIGTPPPPRKSNTALLVGGGVVAVLAIGVVVAIVLVLTRGNSTNTSSSSGLSHKPDITQLTTSLLVDRSSFPVLGDDAHWLGPKEQEGQLNPPQETNRPECAPLPADFRRRGRSSWGRQSSPTYS